MWWTVLENCWVLLLEVETVRRNASKVQIAFRLHKGELFLIAFAPTPVQAAVSRNYGEKSINSVLDYVSTAEDDQLMLRFYETTLEALKEAKNERLWFKTNLKVLASAVFLASLFSVGEFVSCS